MSLSSKDIARKYRAAAALNNVSVAFLERGNYAQAMATLKDAVAVLNCKDAYDSSIDEKIRLASRRQAQTSPQVTKNEPFRVEVVSQCSLAEDVTRVCHEESPSSCLAYPIRLESADFDSSVEQEFDIESACVLYNFGMTYFCMCRITRNEANSTKLMDGAKRLFSVAHSILLGRRAVCIDEGRLEQMLHVEFIVLTCLTQLLRQAAQQKAAVQMYTKLVMVRESINKVSCDGLVRRKVTVAAAA